MYNFHFLKSNYPIVILKTEGRISNFSVAVGCPIPWGLEIAIHIGMMSGHDKKQTH